MNGMILAAGLGTRLYPLTASRAKPAVPFLNRPFLYYSLELLRQADVKEVVINLHHLPDSVTSAVEDIQEKSGDLPEITFSHEEEILGTAGALAKVRDFLEHDTFIVSNGKIYFEEDLRSALAFHRAGESVVTLLLVAGSKDDPYAPVFLDQDNNVRGFARRAGEAGNGRPCVFTGVHILEPRIFDSIPPGPCDTVNDVYPKLIEQGLPVRGFVSQAYWCECSTPRRYLHKSLEVLRRKGLQNLLEDEVEDRCRGAIAGRGLKVDKGSSIENSLLWEDVTIAGNSSLRDVIISGAVELAPETHLRSAIVTPVPGQIDNQHPGQAWVREDCVIWPL